MAFTPVDLFRAGNTKSARLNHVRPDDVDMFDVNGVRFVKARVGGISTQDKVDPTFNGRWWLLPTQSHYDDRLIFVVNDEPGHWAWQPSVDMPLADFEDALSDVNQLFRSV